MALVTRHRAERAAYRRALRVVDHHHFTGETPDAYMGPPPKPPPDEGETLLELLHCQLGAHLIGA